MTTERNVEDARSRSRAAVARRLTAKFVLRFHVVIILLWCYAVGLLATTLFYLVGVESMAWRYALAIVIAYVGFLVAVRVWLWYVGYSRYLRSSSFHVDFPTSSGGGKSETAQVFHGGGGDYAGAGASGDFGAASPVVEAKVSALGAAGDLAGAGAPAAADAAGGASVIGDLAGASAGAGEAAIPLFVILLIVAALVAVVGGAVIAVDLIPEVLIDAAFEALLAGGLIKATRRLGESGWKGAVFSRTWVPALVVLVCGVLFGAVIQSKYPNVKTMGDWIRVMRHG